MAQHNCSQEDVLRFGSKAAGLKDVIFDVATRANDHLITARIMLGNLREGKEAGHEFEHEGEEGHDYESVASGKDDEARTQVKDEIERGFGVLTPAVSTRLFLERLEKADFDVFESSVRGRSLKLPWSAYWAFKQKQI